MQLQLIQGGGSTLHLGQALRGLGPSQAGLQQASKADAVGVASTPGKDRLQEAA